MQLGVKDKAQHHQDNHYHAFYEQGPVLDGLGFVQPQDNLPGLLGHLELPAVDKVEAGDGGQHHQQDRRTGAQNEVVEAEPGGAADHDVGRVANEGGGTPDVGRQDLGHEEGDWVQLQHVGDG